LANERPRYRRLKFGNPSTHDRYLDYLRLLDLADEAAPVASPGPVTPHAQPEPERPRRLEERPLISGEPPELAAHEREAIRKWELSARLDSTLLAEIYGAAADLSAAGATVSSLVEEALRLYLPRLRARYNEGHNFTPRGPRPRNRRGISSLPVAEGTPGERPPTSASASASVDDEAWNQGGGVPRPR